MDEQAVKALIRAAAAARGFAYAPYSGFAVGAALLAADGRVFTGCNIENAAFGPTNCAERTALFKAVSEGARSFRAVAVVGGPAGQKPARATAPCGVCRQALAEFAGPELAVILAADEEEYRQTTLGALLPCSFGARDLAPAAGPSTQ